METLSDEINWFRLPEQVRKLRDSIIEIVVPTKTSDLDNDSNFVQEQALSDVATSGSFDDLVESPIRPDTDDNNRPEWDNGTEWKGLAYVDEVPEESTVDYEAQFNSEIDF